MTSSKQVTAGQQVDMIVSKAPWKSDLPLSDCWQNEEHPEVNSKDQNHLEHQLPQNSLPQIQSTVDHHGPCRQTHCWRDK